ncbi:MAG: hypothetical protein K6E10_03530 [Eubacterium sp.]|nr:hypothetical protein [Eubacterium sp.]
MQTYKVGISDKDLDYATGLMDYAKRFKKTGMQVIVFSSMKGVEDYLETRDLDVVLTDDITGCQVNDGGFTISDVRVVLLTEYRGQGDTFVTEQGLICLYKYQKVGRIYEQLREIIVEKPKNSNRSVTIMGVYSPLGRCGKTRLARALAYDDEVRGGLYVALENYSDNIKSLDSSILYQIRTGSENLDQLIRGEIVEEENLHSLYLSGTYMDTHDIFISDIEKLINILVDFRTFSTIVFDIGSAAIRDMNILTIFDRLYVPVLNDPVSIRKLEVHGKMLKELGLRNLITKEIKVEVPNVGVDSQAMAKTLWKLHGME